MLEEAVGHPKLLPHTQVPTLGSKSACPESHTGQRWRWLPGPLGEGRGEECAHRSETHQPAHPRVPGP